MQVNRSVISSIAQYVPASPVRKGAAIAALAVGILSLGYVTYIILKGRVNRGSVSSEKPVPSQYPDFRNIDEISHRLMAKSNENPEKPSFEPFKLPLGTYVACGPGTLGDQFIPQLKEHLSQYKVVVNLLSKEENNSLGMDDVIWFFSNTERKEFFEGINTKSTYIHFFEWPDMGIPALETIDSLVRCADRVAQLQEKGVAFVHCMQSLQRTPTFIVLVELLKDRHLDHSIWSMNPPYSLIRQHMFDILSTLASTAQGRVPTKSQLQLLFSDAFIARLTAFAKGMDSPLL